MDEKSLLLKRHGGFRGLTDEEIQQIAADCELLELATGDVLHRAGEHLKFLYLIVQGRFQQTTQDPRGNVVQRKYLGRGSQFGAVAAAQEDPVPITVVAVEPSSVLRLEYDTFLQHVIRFPKLLGNLLRDIGTAFKQTFSLDRIHAQSNVVMVVHRSPVSRPLTKRLIDRLQALGEHPCVLTDDPSWEARSDVPQLLLVQDGHWLGDETVRSKIAQWLSLIHI